MITRTMHIMYVTRKDIDGNAQPESEPLEMFGTEHEAVKAAAEAHSDPTIHHVTLITEQVASRDIPYLSKAPLSVGLRRKTSTWGDEVKVGQDAEGVSCEPKSAFATGRQLRKKR